MSVDKVVHCFDEWPCRPRDGRHETREDAVCVVVEGDTCTPVFSGAVQLVGAAFYLGYTKGEYAAAKRMRILTGKQNEQSELGL